MAIQSSQLVYIYLDTHSLSPPSYIYLQAVLYYNQHVRRRRLAVSLAAQEREPYRAQGEGREEEGECLYDPKQARRADEV
jgi:hypothetical protein